MCKSMHACVSATYVMPYILLDIAEHYLVKKHQIYSHIHEEMTTLLSKKNGCKHDLELNLVCD